MKHQFLCAHCGGQYPTHDMYDVQGSELCPACAAELTVVCMHCGQRIYTEDDAGDENISLCNLCRGLYYTECTACGRLLRLSDTYYPDDSENYAYCQDCYDTYQESSPIHDYSYMPELVFHGKGSRFFGVELEIDCGGNEQQNARELLIAANCAEKNLYIKNDGSLNDGLELVTHPMTLDYHLHEMPWKAVLDKARLLGYLSHRAETCGLHIHISRLAFGCTYGQQEAAIARLLYFVEKFWPELLRFSRRTQSQLNRWAARYGAKLTPKEQIDLAKHSAAGRYTAVNLTNSETIEIRIFRGTLKLNTLIATLQLVNHLCEVAVSLSDETLQDMSWYDFLNRIKEPELIQYLKERRLYVNEPVSTTEDD